MKKNKQLIALTAALLFLNSLYSQLKINEYSCSNITTLNDDNGEYHDWIELYNTTAASVNLTGYSLSDSKNNTAKWKFTSGNIPANGYLIVYASEKDRINGSFYHTNFKLTQTKYEKIILANASGTIIDSLTTNPTQENHSRGRTTDGAATWSLFVTPTPGAANANALLEYASRPSMNIAAGFYGSAQLVSITSADAGVNIYYTTDGTTPTAFSTLYTGPVNIASTAVLRARAFSSDPNIPPSFVESNTYFINSSHTTAVISVFGDDVVNLLNDLLFGPDPETDLEYFDKSGQFKTEAYGTSNKHGNDSWSYNQRGIDFVTRDQYGYSYALKHKLFNLKDRKSFQRVILKAAANDNYPFESGSGWGGPSQKAAHIRDAYVHTLSQLGKLHLDERTWEPCVLYANGQYWGVYELREKVDDADFTDYYYHTPAKDLQFIKTWGGTWEEYGSPQALSDWNNLKTYINTNSMAVQSNYNYVDNLFNVKSLVDYFVLNSYVVCSDWLNWNTTWWRGLNPESDKKKWRYALWDEDATFDHYINYTGVPSTNPDADPCNVEQLPDPGGQGHTEFLNKLLANPGFKQYYISRYIDLSNTVFSCSNMIAVLDSMINLIAPEMPKQIGRWGGTVTAWQSNVQTLKDFINNRCIAISQGMKDCYDLTGPYKLCVKVEPPLSGNLNLNSLQLDNYPWTGNYYGGIDILMQADASADYEFDYWESNSSITPNSTDTSIKLNITADGCITAHFKKKSKTSALSMPNVFSPNGDGTNDFFIPVKAEELNSFELLIYNRWGDIIHKSNDSSAGWNGKANGINCPEGAYYWIVKYEDNKKENHTEKGFFTLQR